MLKGIAASAGLGLANALIVPDGDVAVERRTVLKDDVSAELEKLSRAMDLSNSQLEELYKKTKETLGEEAKIIQAQIEMLNDPMIKEEIESAIIEENYSAEYSVQVTLDAQIELFLAIEDEYIRERATDLVDIKMRLLHTLSGTSPELTVNENVIIVCSVLTPSQTANLDSLYVKGIICETGGVTAHAAIIARNLEIPAIMGCKGAMSTFSDGDMLFMDGAKGEVRAVFDEREPIVLRADIERALEAKAQLLEIIATPSITTDGKDVVLSANVGTLEEVKLAQKYGADGIGLFRTEFLYMDSKVAPSENLQFNIYKKAAQQLGGKKAIFRTIDIGGDKEVPFLSIPKEDNPFLGWRAVRICLDDKTLLITQLRALLRASAFGSLKIMIPMISSVFEIRAVREIFEEVKAGLAEEKIPFDAETELGIMVEIPSAAVCADMLIEESDFFSIGTNDLIQYSLAVDRGNEKVSSYYDFYNPAVLRLVKMTIDASHGAGKTTGMCGEAAGDPIATLLLLGLGLDSFSMAPSVLPKVKKIITSVSTDFARDIADAAMKMDSGAQIREFLIGKLREVELDYLIDL